MGFDNECILNIQSLAGEYFCPVCRLLVYPNEALQSQCTHLYCKPCLSYVVGTTKACPYDGYLVTEADSKPLIESNKTLAETIGKIEVHCLYHRSGCPWKGPLSDCTTHCSGCAFGNSPVVCNRCGVQIVHRQVQDHAQNCPGVQSQAQPTGSLQSKSATAASADHTKVVTQPGSATSQALPLQGITTPAQGQNQNQPAGSINHPQSTAQATSDQWYQQQQQYQQYYQPYAGYDPYQQYNPYQQQAVQQYQQHQGHAYPPTASAVQTLQSTQAQPQTQIQSHPQAQPFSQPPTQSSVQPSPQTQPHSLVNVQPAATQQLQPHLPIPSLPQMQPHTHQTAQGHPQPQSQQHHHSLSLPQSHSMQPYPQQQQQMLPYQQSQSQMQLLQPQAQPQPPIPQPHSQAQPPVQACFPTQQYQPAITKIQTPMQHPSALPVTSHQSYPQIQAHQQVQLAAPQHIAHMNPQTGPSQQVQHVSQVHAQLPQQAMHMRPSQPQGVVPNNQPPTLLPSTGQSQNMPSTQKQFVQPPQQQGYSGQHHPYMQSNQQVPRPPQFVPQQSSVPQQQQHVPMNAQLRPQGLPLSQNQSTAYLQSQQTAMPPYQSQVGPSMSNINVLPRSVSSARNGVADSFQVKPMEVVGDQKYESRTNLQLQSLPELQTTNSQFEDKHLSGKSIYGQGVKAPEQQVYNEEANASVATSDPHVDSVETNVLMSETDPKLREGKPGKDDTSLNGRFSAEYATGVGPELCVLGNGESTINQVMKHGAGDGTQETMSGNPQQDSNGLHAETEHPSFQEDARQKIENHDKGSLASHYGPSSVQQKSLSGQTHAQVPRHPPHHQFRSQHADTFLHPALGGMSGPRPERGLGQPPAHKSFEQPSSHPGFNNQGFPSVGGSLQGAVPPGSIDSQGMMSGRAQPPGPDGKTGLQRPISRSGLWEDGFNKITREGHLYPFDMEPGGRVARVEEFQNLNRYSMPPNVDSELVHGLGNYFPSSRTDDRFPHKFGLDPLSRNSDKGPHGFINETQLRNAGERLLPGGFGDDNMGRPNFPHPDFLGPDTGYGRYPSLASRNSHQEYPGDFTHGISPADRSGRDIGRRNFRRFGEGSRPFSLNSESKEFPLHEKKFPNMPPHLRSGELESNMNMQMGDNVPPGPSHMLRSGELIGRDPLPGHFHRGEHFGPNSHLRVGEPAAFAAFSSHRIGDMSRFGNFPTRHGEAGFRSTYSPQDSNFFMGEESFENPRKRKSAASMGWCRICKVDCETVEGLDVHSQTREHQRKSMDMVLKIKQKNAKKQKLNSTDHSSVDELKESRIGGFEGRGDKR